MFADWKVYALIVGGFAALQWNSFKDLHNVLMLINELKPQFSNNGEDLHCEVEYNGERVIITADCENCNLDKIIIDGTTYDFD